VNCSHAIYISHRIKTLLIVRYLLQLRMIGFQKDYVKAKVCNLENVQARAEVEASHRYAENSLEEALFEWLKFRAMAPPLKKKADYEQFLAKYRNNYLNCFLYNNQNTSASSLQSPFLQRMCDMEVGTKKELERMFSDMTLECHDRLQPFVGGHCYKTPVAVIAAIAPDADLSSLWYHDEVEQMRLGHEKTGEMDQYQLQFYSDEHLQMIQDLKRVYNQFITNYINDSTPTNAYNQTWTEQSALHNSSFFSTLQRIEKEKSEHALALKQSKDMLEESQFNLLRTREQLDSCRQTTNSDRQLIHHLNVQIYNMRCQIQSMLQSSRPIHSGPYRNQSQSYRNETSTCYRETQPYRNERPVSHVNPHAHRHNPPPYRKETQPYCPPSRTVQFQPSLTH
jgi:hypothetical protein